MRPLELLVTGRSASELEQLTAGLSGIHNARVSSRAMGDNWLSSLQAHTPAPDIIVLCLGDAPERDLMQLGSWASPQRPPVLLVGALQDSEDQTRLLRLAMQAGARDFISRPVSMENLIDEINQIRREREHVGQERSAVTVFISPKGGAGAASTAAGVAHALVAHYNLPCLLLDLNYQFGAQYLNLDLHPDKGLKEAIEAAESLDSLALAGYVTRHRSGLHALGTLPSQLLLPSDVADQRLDKLLETIEQTYNQVIIDLPCLIDPLFNLVVERASQVLLVIQQDFQNIRNGQKLLRILKEELRIPSDRVNLVINRFERHNSITIEHITQSLQLEPVSIIPSDFRLVNGAANLGVPVLEHSPDAPLSLALIELAGWISGASAEPASRSFWDRLTAFFKGS